METIKLYHRDTYQKTFTAILVHQEQQADGSWRVQLDRTAFYPESGGQPYDLGTINEQEVTKVIEEEGIVYHYLTYPIQEKEVIGRIHFERRMDHMQQHCGQHILSAAFREVNQMETVSFHLGRTESTIDIDTEELTLEMIHQVENLANQIVLENRHIETRLVTRDELEMYGANKVPAHVDHVRMIHITDFDLNACGGTHPHRTGEVGMIKILRTEKNRGGQRVTFVCGNRALKAAQITHEIVMETARQLGTNPASVPSKLEFMQDELKQAQKQLQHYRQELLCYKTMLMQPIFEQRIDEQAYEVYISIEQHSAFQECKDLAKTLIEQPKRIVLSVNELENAYQLVIAISQDVRHLSAQLMVEDLISQHSGNGGGSRVFSQWRGPKLFDPVTWFKAILRRFE